jgi:serine protease AprX
MTTVQTLTVPSSHDTDRSVDGARIDPRRARTVYEPPRGSTLLALATSAALVLGGVALANVDNGPTTPVEPAIVSMRDVVDGIGARTLWEQGFTGEGVNVAVIDTGIARVPELADHVVAAVDLSAEGLDHATAFVDSFGHGTHMAGIIAGREPGFDPSDSSDASDEFVGVAPDAGIVSVKVAGRDGTVTGANLVAGIDWAVDHADELDIAVLTLAFDAGTIASYRNDPVAAALERAWNAGIVVVTAAGNAGADSGQLASAALDPFVIAVAGVDTSAASPIPAWASAGDGERNPDVAAPGAHIASLRSPGSDADVNHHEGYVDQQRFLASGSSQAAAVVAGGVALLLDARPDLDPTQVKYILADSATAIQGPAELVGNGLIDLAAALDTSPTVDTQSWTPASATNSVTADIPMTLDFATTSSAWTSSAWTSSAWTSSAWTSSAWTSSAWTSSAWTGSAWTSSAWTSSAWTSSAWTSSAWTSSAWTSSAWTSSAWTSSAWTSSAWTSSAWTSSAWTSSAWTSSAWTSSAWT